LVAVNAGIFVAPEAEQPVFVLLLVQLKLAPAGVLVNVFNGTVAPAQTVIFGSATTVGEDPTVTVTVAELEQLPVDPTTVYVVVTDGVAITVATLFTFKVALGVHE
jgi:hypothetical protein